MGKHSSKIQWNSISSLTVILFLQEENINYKRLGFKYLCDKNKELENRINKAIEYIKSNNYGDDEDNYETVALYMPELVNILNGGDE